ncbi:MAG: M20/M25/M40 family metallo-hydrolase [Chloroflexi bacterium]|nr:M20/M25/M40 family metallo-hydrolase [Chloroflexota bacterium]
MVPQFNSQRLLTALLDLLRLDSPSQHEGPAVDYVRQAFAALDIPTSVDAANNIYAHIPGKGGSIAALMLNAHVDTVRPTPTMVPQFAGGVISSNGESVLGADDKAGVAAILEIVRTLAESGVEHVPLDVLVTTGEELGLLGAKQVDFNRVQARQGLCLDSDGPAHHVVVAAPGQNDVRATFTGQSAHAGLEPEKGRNAIVAAARAVAAMPLGRIDLETTANIGIIQGGSARNIVPDHCEVTGEARSRNTQKLEAQTAAMVRALEDAARATGCHAEVAVKENYKAYSHSADTAIVQRCVRSLQAIGRDPVLKATGGGADANVFNAAGIQTVLLGVGYEQIHTAQERIAVAAVEDLTRVVLKIVTDA